MMVRFTLPIPDDLNTWLIQDARKNGRSKNKQIEYLLSQARKETERRRCLIGSAAMCANGNHNFKSDNPEINEFCNCGVFVYGEICR